jgi:dihydrofolate reductase
VITDITMSLDGFVTGPNAGPKAGLGDDGIPIRDWVFNGHEVDEAVLANATQRTDAAVMGRNIFDVGDGPDGWNDEIGYGAHHVGRPPYFVETHNPPAQVRLNLDFTFVTEGVGRALDAACAVCPPDKEVVIMGGGNVIAQATDQGLVDAACFPNRDVRRHTALGPASRGASYARPMSGCRLTRPTSPMHSRRA